MQLEHASSDYSLNTGPYLQYYTNTFFNTTTPQMDHMREKHTDEQWCDFLEARV